MALRPDKRMLQTIEEAGVSLLLEAAQDKYVQHFSDLTACRMLLSVVADCIEKDDMQGLKFLLKKIREYGSR